MKKNVLLTVLILASFQLFSSELKFSTFVNQSLFHICSEIVTEIYSRLDYEVSIIEMSSMRAIKESEAGRTDGEVGRMYSYSDICSEVIAVPTPYYGADTTAFVRSDSGISGVTVENLNQFSVARISGVLNTDLLTSEVEETFDFLTIEDMLRFLQYRDDADLALVNRIGGLIALRKYEINGIVPLSPPIVRRDIYHFVNKKNAALVPRLNSMIKELKSSGELDEIIQRAEERVFQEQ